MEPRQLCPLEITHTSPRVEAYDHETNEKGVRLALDLIDEVRDEANARNAERQKKASFHCDQRVKEKFFRQDNLTLRKIEASRVGQKGRLSPNWEGSYRVRKTPGRGFYRLEIWDDEHIPRLRIESLNFKSQHNIN